MPEQPMVNARQQITAILRPAEEARYKIPSGKTMIITVAGMLPMLKTNAFVISCFIPH